MKKYYLFALLVVSGAGLYAGQDDCESGQTPRLELKPLFKSAAPEEVKEIGFPSDDTSFDQTELSPLGQAILQNNMTEVIRLLKKEEADLNK